MLPAAREYEAMKILLVEFTQNGGHEIYTKGKQTTINRLLRQAVADSYFRKTVTVKIDRPLGSVHPQHPGVVKPLNDGYLPENPGFDGELKFLLLFQKKTKSRSFPKGHMERGETETKTALREIKEKTGCTSTLLSVFRVPVLYSLRDGTEKEVILFLTQRIPTPFWPKTKLPSSVLRRKRRQRRCCWLRFTLLSTKPLSGLKFSKERKR